MIVDNATCDVASCADEEECVEIYDDTNACIKPRPTVTADEEMCDNMTCGGHG